VTFTRRQLALLAAARDQEAPGEALETLVARAAGAGGPAAAAPAADPARAADGLVVAQGEAVAVRLVPGDVLRIAQVDGGQCADVLAWGPAGADEPLSASRTRSLEGASPTSGSRLLSAWPHERPLLEIVRDTAPGHDLLHPACSPLEYASIGAVGDPSCVAVQAEAIAAAGLEGVTPHDPLNLWFAPTLTGPRSVLGWRQTPTAPGDEVALRALCDVVVVVNPCVDDVFGCSVRPGGAIRVAVEPPEREIVRSGAPVPVDTLTVQLPEALPDDAVRGRAVRHALAVLGEAGG
jgi:uncharacterized protein YcgI (DUF1989 family)